MDVLELRDYLDSIKLETLDKLSLELKINVELSTDHWLHRTIYKDFNVMGFDLKLNLDEEYNVLTIENQTPVYID